MDTRRRHEQELIDRYERGENVSLDELSPPTRDRLRAERAARADLRAAFEAKQVAQGQERAEALRLAFISQGGTNAEWAKEAPAILAEDRKQRAREGVQRRVDR
jgi:hypothetical protein